MNDEPGDAMTSGEAGYATARTEYAAFEERLAALRLPGAFPFAVNGPVEVVQTHASAVLLAGDRAYKLKKPNDFGFFNYSTPALRRRFCSLEARLNRRLAAGVYLGVAPVLEDDQRRVSFGPELAPDDAPEPGGEFAGKRVVDYAVVMTRLPEEATLAALVRTGQADAALMERIARQVAAFHAAAETSERIARFGGVEVITGNWDENFEQMRPYIGRALSAETFDQIERYVRDFLRRRATFIAARAREGRVRDLHGDLRLQHVYTLRAMDLTPRPPLPRGEGEPEPWQSGASGVVKVPSPVGEGWRDSAGVRSSPVGEGWRDSAGVRPSPLEEGEPAEIAIVDCIEFNDRFHFEDVASEVAFLTMELDEAGRADLSRAFVDGYVAASGDTEVRELLPFYLCYRACVRGKVLSFQLDQTEVPATQREAARQQASALFELAARYASGPAEPTLLLIGGRMGTGKTTLGAALRHELGWELLSSDATRKRLAGVAEDALYPEAFGAGLYSAEWNARTYAGLRDEAARALAEGRSVIVDAAFGRRADRMALVTLGNDMGARVIYCECRCPREEALRRLEARWRERVDGAGAATADAERVEASDGRPAIAEAQTAAWEPFDDAVESAIQYAALTTTEPLSVTVAHALDALAVARAACFL
ncbi:MAG TPA: AAA family ATPase [Ktedonobacterales bacterium]|nr:AAA family ATPase [Ktedonobacterales bacterium]